MIVYGTIQPSLQSRFVSMNRKPMALWDDAFSKGTVSASSKDTTQGNDWSPENTTDGATNDFWRPATMPATIQSDLTTAETVDCAVILAHELGSKGSVVTFQYWDGAAWVDVATATPTDNTPIMFLFHDITSTIYRFSITGAEVPSIGLIMVGKRLVFMGGITTPYTPIPYARDFQLLANESRNGQLLGNRIEKRGYGGTINFGLMTRGWYESHAIGFMDHYDEGKGFLFASNVNKLPYDVSLCWRSGNEIGPQLNDGAEEYRIGLTVRAYVS